MVWFVSLVHFCQEFCTENPGVAWGENNSENAALFAVAQQIKIAQPNSDIGHMILEHTPRAIALPMKCKGQPFSIVLRHFPTGVMVDYGNARAQMQFLFMLSIKIEGAKLIHYRRNEVRSAAVNMHDFDDVYNWGAGADV